MERLLLIYPDEFVYVVTTGLSLHKDGVAVDWREFGSARENPEVIAGAAADESVGIVRSEQKNTVVGVEGAEEGNAKQARSRSCLGLAL